MKLDPNILVYSGTSALGTGTNVPFFVRQSSSAFLEMAYSIAFWSLFDILLRRLFSLLLVGVVVKIVV